MDKNLDHQSENSYHDDDEVANYLLDDNYYQEGGKNEAVNNETLNYFDEIC